MLKAITPDQDSLLPRVPTRRGVFLGQNRVSSPRFPSTPCVCLPRSLTPAKPPLSLGLLFEVRCCSHYYHNESFRYLRFCFRSSITAASTLAVYASRFGHPTRARLASGRPTTPLPGRTFTCWATTRSFSLYSRLPLLSDLAWRHPGRIGG